MRHSIWSKTSKNCKMKARKLLSNSSEVHTMLPKKRRAFEIDLNDNLPTTKNLGVLRAGRLDLSSQETNRRR